LVSAFDRTLISCAFFYDTRQLVTSGEGISDRFTKTYSKPGGFHGRA
jgi:hypothetical protein